MINFTCVENKIFNNNELYSCFKFYPMTANLALTLGNLLKQILINEITGAAITGVKFVHSVDNIRSNLTLSTKENLFELLLNIQKTIIQTNLLLKTEGFINEKGPKIISSKHLHFPKHVSIINKKNYIASLLNKEKLNLICRIEAGKGFILSDEISNSENWIPLDVKFSPVLKVNFKIKLNASSNLINEELYLEIWTNGAITPKGVLLESLGVIHNLINQLIFNFTI